jgi:hypothetical protein
MPLFKKKVIKKMGEFGNVNGRTIKENSYNGMGTFDKCLGLVMFEGSLTGNSEDHSEGKTIQGVACFRCHEI